MRESEIPLDKLRRVKDFEAAVAVAAVAAATSIRKEGEGLRASLNKRNVTGAMMSGYAIAAERTGDG